MKIQVNGQQHEVEPASTVADLIDRLQLRGAACAVEVNRRVVPGREHPERRLCEGDTVEIVTLVGGG